MWKYLHGKIFSFSWSNCVILLISTILHVLRTPSHLIHSIILSWVPSPHLEWTSVNLQPATSSLILQEKHDSKRQDLISSLGPQLLSSPPLFSICRVRIWKPTVRGWSKMVIKMFQSQDDGSVTNIKFSSSCVSNKVWMSTTNSQETWIYWQQVTLLKIKTAALWHLKTVCFKL